VPAGRRSGKTEIAKRRLARAALRGTAETMPRFFAAAPTRDQAKRIFWADLKALIPRRFIAGQPSESDLTIRLVTSAELHVLGMDRPERIEGVPWDGGVLDEYANMKAEVWGTHVRPALSDRRGWCDLIGVPEGRNHYYERHKQALALMQAEGACSEWATFTWKSADILPAAEIAAARRDLDTLTFQQEYEASFVSFQGRAYYAFDEQVHTAPLAYDPREPLAACFDFNVAPGIAAVCQEQRLPNGETGTGVIGEVHIPRNSNTEIVCRRLIEDWGAHAGLVRLYGDATGGAGGSAKVQGSDWELVEQHLRPVFGDRLQWRVPGANPRERERVNALNARLRNAADVVRLMVDGARAPNVIKDFEGVRLIEGSAGEIDKRRDPQLSHLSDALGYYIDFEFPVQGRGSTTMPVVGA
jgi:hypothetical protein